MCCERDCCLGYTNHDCREKRGFGPSWKVMRCEQAVNSRSWSLVKGHPGGRGDESEHCTVQLSILTDKKSRSTPR